MVDPRSGVRGISRGRNRSRIAYHVLRVGMAVIGLAGAASADPSAPDEAAARRARVESTIRFLADDLLEGRGTPGRGLDIAAVYLAAELQAAGLAPANGDSYFQSYQVKEFLPGAAHYEITLAGKRLEPAEFILVPFGLDPAQPLRADLVFAGYGVVAPERKVNDLAGVDVRDRAVVALLGAPWPLDPQAAFGYDRAVGKSIETFIRNGKLLVYVTSELDPPDTTSTEVVLMEEGKNVPAAMLADFRGGSSMGLGSTLAITPAAFDRTLGPVVGNTYAELQVLAAKGKLKARPIPAQVELKVVAEVKTAEARNVVGMIRGSDPTLREEWVVMTAHYDHLGQKEVPAGEDGIWNGADDNASGTAAILEIARAIARGPAPRRSLLVLFMSGEERGLLGSAHYSQHPLVPYDRVVLDLNVDMVGRSTGKVQGIAPTCAPLFEETVAIGKEHGIAVDPDQQLSWRVAYLTDSYHFTRFDVPAIEFFTGMHADYHQPSDSVEKIRYAELGRILAVMEGLTRRYVDGAPKPKVTRPAWFLTPD
jgi:peptidase M28-like protein